MGDGLILQQGTHNELLRDEKGPYSRLVAVQKLREQREIEFTNSDSDTTRVKSEDMEKKARDRVPLGRNNSLASEMIEQNTKLQIGEMREDDHSLHYLLIRMVKLNRAGWKNYVIGVVAAWSTYLFICCSSQNVLTGHN
jgi:ATP-binding cassette subfamily B (MDR/TAP) protein 1